MLVILAYKKCVMRMGEWIGKVTFGNIKEGKLSHTGKQLKF